MRADSTAFLLAVRGAAAGGQEWSKITPGALGSMRADRTGFLLAVRGAARALPSQTGAFASAPALRPAVFALPRRAHAAALALGPAAVSQTPPWRRRAHAAAALALGERSKVSPANQVGAMQEFLSAQNVPDRAIKSVRRRQKGILSQDLGLFREKWSRLADQPSLNSIFATEPDKQVLVALRLRDEAACDCFISVIDAYQAGATQALTATKASRFVKMANEVALREWFSQYIPKARWPSLLNRRSLCSAVVSGKGDHLIAFLIKTRIPRDKWPSLLGSNSLCSAVANGKGGELLAFLDEAQIPREKWPSLLGTDGLCSAVANGKGGELLEFLIESRIAREKWPSLLGRSSLCSAVVDGKGDQLMKFLIEAQIPTDKWPSLLGRDSLCSAIVTGKGMDLKVCLEQSCVPKEKWHTVLRINSLCSAMASGRPVDLSRFLT